MSTIDTPLGNITLWEKTFGPQSPDSPAVPNDRGLFNSNIVNYVKDDQVFIEELIGSIKIRSVYLMINSNTVPQGTPITDTDYWLKTGESVLSVDVSLTKDEVITILEASHRPSAKRVLNELGEFVELEDTIDQDHRSTEVSVLATSGREIDMLDARYGIGGATNVSISRNGVYEIGGSVSTLIITVSASVSEFVLDDPHSIAAPLGVSVVFVDGVGWSSFPVGGRVRFIRTGRMWSIDFERGSAPSLFSTAKQYANAIIIGGDFVRNVLNCNTSFGVDTGRTADLNLAGVDVYSKGNESFDVADIVDLEDKLTNDPLFNNDETLVVIDPFSTATLQGHYSPDFAKGDEIYEEIVAMVDRLAALDVGNNNIRENIMIIPPPFAISGLSQHDWNAPSPHRYYIKRAHDLVERIESSRSYFYGDAFTIDVPAYTRDTVNSDPMDTLLALDADGNRFGVNHSASSQAVFQGLVTSALRHFIDTTTVQPGPNPALNIPDIDIPAFAHPYKGIEVNPFRISINLGSSTQEEPVNTFTPTNIETEEAKPLYTDGDLIAPSDVTLSIMSVEANSASASTFNDQLGGIIGFDEGDTIFTDAFSATGIFVKTDNTLKLQFNGLEASTTYKIGILSCGVIADTLPKILINGVDVTTPLPDGRPKVGHPNPAEVIFFEGTSDGIGDLDIQFAYDTFRTGMAAASLVNALTIEAV